MADRADKTNIEIAHFFLINKKRAPKAPQNTAKANAAVYHAGYSTRNSAYCSSGSAAIISSVANALPK